MINQILPYFLVYFFIIISILGIGVFFLQLTIKSKTIKFFDLGYIGLFGIFFTLLYSYFSNLFFAHSEIHNLIFLFVGFLLFIFNFKLFTKLDEIKIVLSIFFLLFFGFIIFKTHDDFVYYHFPYTYNLTQNSLLIGIGNFNHGFKTPSSLFYINSIFYIPYFKYYLFHMGAILFMGFSCSSLLISIKEQLSKKFIDHTFFLSLMSILFILIFFYRISEHGTDRSAQILIFLLFIQIIQINSNYNNFLLNFTKIAVITGLIISLKAFYILYFIFFIPLLFDLIKNNKIYLVKKIFSEIYFYLLIVLFAFVLFTNFANSGCLIFPISFTCFEGYSWSIPLNTVELMNNWYEQWSKAGAGPNFRVENPEIYIKKFNWVNHWVENYFFTKVSDLIGGIIILFLIFFAMFKTQKKFKSLKINFLILLVLILLFCEWFYNHPSLRYGGYVLFALLIFYPLTLLLEAEKKNINYFNKKVILLLFFASLIFIGRNINRIVNESEKYNYMPIVNFNYNVNEDHFRINQRFKKLINNHKDCELKKIDNSCDQNLDFKVKKKYKYYIFYK